MMCIIAISGCTESKDKLNDKPKATICTADWNPVCGVDGNTYANECNAGDVEIAYEGECKIVHICTAEEKENQICTREYIPVCGSDNVTYATGCTACAAGIDSWTQYECGV